MARLRALGLVRSAAIVWLCACWPAPYDVTPPLDGRITRAGLPAPSIPVRLSVFSDTTCSTPVRQGASDEAGAFRFARVRRWEVVSPFLPMTRRAGWWHLCVPNEAPLPAADWAMVLQYLGGAIFDRTYRCRLEIGAQPRRGMCLDPWTGRPLGDSTLAPDA